MASGDLVGRAPIIASILVGIAVAIFFKNRKKEEHGAASPAIGGSGHEGSTSALSSSSSSSLLIPHGYEFEVFLSFRGPDTRDIFTDFLYEDLIEKGIGAFRDEEGLHKGGEIDSNLVEAIKKSKMYIPIFSKGYADSKWCLKELAQMVDCMRETKQAILPIFYDVTPHDVRHQTGDFKAAFSSHERNYPKDVQKWRKALQVVGKLKGWDLTIPPNRSQGRIVKIIVLDVQTRLKKPLDVVDKLTGIDDHVVKIMDLLEVDVQDVRVVGLWGLGGVGKTTIAKFIYNELMHQFDFCSFLSNVGEKSQQPGGLVSLQKQLLSGISKHTVEKNSSVDDGKYILKNRSMRKVLVLIDDVDQVNQLEALVPSLNNFDPGSRIIVTTRENEVLEGYDVERIHQVTELSKDDAVELFCKHAFKEGFLVNDYFDLSLEIVKATGGLPLSIEVIGSYLSKNCERKFWQEALRWLSKADRILSKLKISYDRLGQDSKEIFLDIACLYDGMDTRILSHMWERMKFAVETSLNELQQRCLVKIGDDNKLWMHNHLKDLGREIVRQRSNSELGKQSRLWDKEDVVTLLNSKEGTSTVKAIRLDNGLESEEYFICGDMFKGLSNLRYLELVGAKLGENFHGELLQLFWLSWNGCTTPLIMPSTVRMQNLIILDLSKSNVEENWSGWNSLKVATELQVLNLASCRYLTKTPDFSSFRRMKRLILEGCSGLVEVGPSIGHLKELVFLDLRNCGSLKELPNELGSLGGLVDLLIDGCTAVKKLPMNLEGMSNLETLSAKSCTSLLDIPPSVGSLLALKRFWLDNCRSVVEIPTEIGELKSLEELSLPCTKIANLPDSIGLLSNLKVLNISQCPIQMLRQSLWELKKLEEMNASMCQNLAGDIPPELGELHRLRILRLDGTSVTSIPDSIIRLFNMKTLDLEGCWKLPTLPELPRSLSMVTSPVNIPNLPDLISLIQLGIVPRFSGPYEVYVSFSKPDTQSFISDLFSQLEDSGLSVFRNARELPNYGMEIDPRDDAVLTRCIIFIPILSKSYAYSRWRLMELTRMVECMQRRDHILLPLFYGVEPREVRHQTGSFGNAFSKHVEMCNPDLIQMWRDALKWVGSLKGWVSDFNSDFGKKLPKQIARTSLQRKNNFIVDILIGMETHTKNVMRLMDVEANDVRLVGVHGVGGAGKTTLARIIYDHLKGQFSLCSFLRDIARTAQESKGLESLRRQLISDISKQNVRSEEFAEGNSTVLRNIFRDKKVLIILDDVNHIEQLHNLVGNPDWFGPGSRIIVTTRLREVLTKYGVVKQIYHVRELPEDSALQLFCNHAFGQDSPPIHSNLAHLSKGIVSALGGIPISIETVGSCLSFHHEDSNVWRDITEKVLHFDINTQLKVCYDALSDQQKVIFSDVACLFFGVDKSIPIHMWQARGLFPEYEIRGLQRRSLIKIGDDGKLWMHDHLRDLGRNIVVEKSGNELGSRSRIWHGGDAIELLQHKKGTYKVEAISLEWGAESDNHTFSSEAFEELSNLWFLALGDAGLDGDFHEGLLPNLRWLSWHGNNLLKVPTDLHLKSLVVLDLSRSAITDEWDGWGLMKSAEQLQVLNLTSCHRLKTTPDFSSFLRMKRLILEDCRGLTEVHPSIGRLTELEFLNMRNCRSLKKLPPDEFKCLVALTELLIDETPIREVPITSEMKYLETLSAKSCKYLTLNPQLLKSLSSLRKVIINQSQT